MRRKDRERDSSFALEVIRDCEYATLAMITPEGKPYALPLNVALLGDTVVFHGAKVGFKTDCLNANSNVCLTCVTATKRDEPNLTMLYSSAILTGNCTLVTDITMKKEALLAICQKYAPSEMTIGIEAAERMAAHTAVYAITATALTGKENIGK